MRRIAALVRRKRVQGLLLWFVSAQAELHGWVDSGTAMMGKDFGLLLAGIGVVDAELRKDS